MSRAAVVVQPVKATAVPTLRADVERAMAEHGWDPPLWLETSEGDPGEGQTREAVRQRVDVVIAAGGDGTVTACASVLAGGDVPLAVLPLGTGNLLVRNLGLPDDPADVVAAAVSEDERVIDVGRLVDHQQERRFLVMAGIGFDAEMIRDAPEAVKSRLSWGAYVVSGLRHLRDRRVAVQIRVDDQPSLRRRVRGVVIGNVGNLQGGLPLLPDAKPDDGVLDVAVLSPRGMLGWFRLAGAVLLRRRASPTVEHLRGRRIEVRAHGPQARQVDGEVLEDGEGLAVEVQPGALRLRVGPSDPAG